MGLPPVPVPRYGSASLADLPGSILSSLGVPGVVNTLELPDARRVCLLVIDGLGWELLRAHPDQAPFLASLPGSPLTAGFPSSTVASLASLGTGRPPGSHGMLGYQMAVPGMERLMNCLRWDPPADPQIIQPNETVYAKAAQAGVGVSYVASGAFKGTGFTEATARGASYAPADSLGQLVAQAEARLAASDRAFVTVYHGDLDSAGHVTGAGSSAWRHQLRFVDLLAERVASVVPDDCRLYVTADHGMVNPVTRFDVDAADGLREGVAFLGGEARARYVYPVPGAESDVLAAWRDVLGESTWVVSRAEAVEAGWFGVVRPELVPRIGDVIAVPHGDAAIVATRGEPKESRLVGMHGAMTSAEQLVPLLAASR